MDHQVDLLPFRWPYPFATSPRCRRRVDRVARFTAQNVGLAFLYRNKEIIHRIVQLQQRKIRLQGEPQLVNTPSLSGKGQKVARCPACRIALWSNYAGGGDLVRFVRVGTLDEPDRLPPDIHIYTESKQPWVVLGPETPAVPEYYDRNAYWPKESLERRARLFASRASGS